MTNTVNSPSGDHNRMMPYWTKVEAVTGGVEVIRQHPEFLPKFPNEDTKDYEFRRQNSKLTDVFGDIIETLSAKPFSKQVAVSNDPPVGWAVEFSEDVDSRGNNLHVFSSQLFYRGVKDAISWVLIDYTRNVPENITQAQAEQLGVRPYWVMIDSRNLIASYTDQINGREEFVHVRIRENIIIREGFDETLKERVRVMVRDLEEGSYGPARFELWEKQSTAATSATEEWVIIDEGPISIGVIPLVPFLTGRRLDSSFVVKPVLKGAVDLQIELYNQESGLKYIKDSAAFPMLAGNGVEPPKDKQGNVEMIPIGPKVVLFAPPNTDGDNGQWSFIEPSSESMKFLASDVKETISQLRELGRQPLTAQTGNLTVVTTAFAADKANSVIQAWVFNLIDTLENCYRFTAMWLNETDEVTVFADTDLDLKIDGENDVSSLTTARQNGWITQETYWFELQRRGILSPDFDAEREDRELLGELPGEEDDVG